VKIAWRQRARAHFLNHCYSPAGEEKGGGGGKKKGGANAVRIFVIIKYTNSEEFDIFGIHYFRNVEEKGSREEKGVIAL